VSLRWIKTPADRFDFFIPTKKIFMEFLKDLFSFVRARRKWWLMPLIVILLLIGVLVILGGTSLAPFIYTLF
jgi:hypothetical protein